MAHYKATVCCIPLETREYYQATDIKWIEQKGAWKGLKSIIMEKKNLQKVENIRVKYRYFISSLKENIDLASRAVRGHWSIESMHWHLDVTFREDANATIDKMAAQNLNIIRKWCLSILKITEVSKKKRSMKKKRYAIRLCPLDSLK